MKWHFLSRIILTLIGSITPLWAADLYTYRNSRNPEQLDLDSVRNIFDSRRLDWKDGKSIVFLYQDFTKVDDKLFESFSDISKSQFLVRWRAKFFSGRARMPIRFTNEADALRTVRETDEAIYFSFTPVENGTPSEGIREEKFSF